MSSKNILVIGNGMVGHHFVETLVNSGSRGVGSLRGGPGIRGGEDREGAGGEGRKE